MITVIKGNQKGMILPELKDKYVKKGWKVVGENTTQTPAPAPQGNTTQTPAH